MKNVQITFHTDGLEETTRLVEVEVESPDVLVRANRELAEKSWPSKVDPWPDDTPSSVRVIFEKEGIRIARVVGGEEISYTTMTYDDFLAEVRL
jgi:hypothetical protein